MEPIFVCLVIIIGMSISLLAINLWIALIDGIVNVFKRLFHSKPKNNTAWHTLNENKAADD